MEIKIGHILEGITNSVFLKEEVEKIAKYRQIICDECEHHSRFHESARPDDHCNICKCNLHLKTRSLHSACPEKKWGAVVDEEQAKTIKKIIDNDPIGNTKG